MKKGIRGNILLVAAMCILSGCAETPEVVEENGIHYALNENDESIMNIIENDTEKDVYLTASEDENKCVCRIGDLDNVMDINAIIDGGIWKQYQQGQQSLFQMQSMWKRL